MAVLSGLKAGIPFPPEQIKVAEQALLHHHATDPSMRDSWRVQQVAQQAAAAALNAMQQEGPNGYGNFGNGNGWQGQGRPIGQPGGSYQGKPKPCSRCGSNHHHQANCSVLHDGAVCQGCGKSGDLQKMCRSKDTSSNGNACKCCGDTGRAKPDCPWKDETCEACNKKGHFIHICRKANKTELSDKWGSSGTSGNLLTSASKAAVP